MAAVIGPGLDESEEEYLNEHGLNWGDLDDPEEPEEWDGSVEGDGGDVQEE